MEVSSTSINAARATVAAISQGFVFGFHAYIAALAADASAVVAIGLRFLSDLTAWPYALLIDGRVWFLDAVARVRLKDTPRFLSMLGRFAGEERIQESWRVP